MWHFTAKSHWRPYWEVCCSGKYSAGPVLPLWGLPVSAGELNVLLWYCYQIMTTNILMNNAMLYSFIWYTLLLWYFRKHNVGFSRSFFNLLFYERTTYIFILSRYTGIGVTCKSCNWHCEVHCCIQFTLFNCLHIYFVLFISWKLIHYSLLFVYFYHPRSGLVVVLMASVCPSFVCLYVTR